MRTLTIVLVYLISQNLFAVTIDVTGTGNDQKWELKSLPQTNSVIVNYDDDLDQVDFTSNENTAQELTDPFDTTGDGSDGNPHVITDDDGLNNTWKNDYTNNGENLSTVFDNPNRDPTTQSNLLDSDDDVPMLKEIKAVLQSYEDTLAQKDIQESIEQSLLAFRAELNATRGDLGEGNQTRKATLADIANRVTDIQGQIYIDGLGYKDTQLSDLHKELVKLNDGNVTENNFTGVTAETISAQKQQVDDAFDSLDQLQDNIEVTAPSSLEPHEASVMLSWKFMEDKSFDLLNISDASGFSIPSLKEAGGYVKMFLGWVIAIIFIIAMKNLALDVLKNIPKQTTSAPVTNWSIGGFSVGALLSKSAYLGALVTFIIAVAGGLVIVNDEAKLLGDIGSESSSIGTYLSSLIDGHGFMSEAFRYLLLFVPVGSIFVTIGTYYKFKIVTWLMINGAVLGMRAVT